MGRCERFYKWKAVHFAFAVLEHGCPRATSKANYHPISTRVAMLLFI